MMLDCFRETISNYLFLPYFTCNQTDGKFWFVCIIIYHIKTAFIVVIYIILLYYNINQFYCVEISNMFWGFLLYTIVNIFFV